MPVTSPFNKFEIADDSIDTRFEGAIGAVKGDANGNWRSEIGNWVDIKSIASSRAHILLGRKFFGVYVMETQDAVSIRWVKVAESVHKLLGVAAGTPNRKVLPVAGGEDGGGERSHPPSY